MCFIHLLTNPNRRFIHDVYTDTNRDIRDTANKYESNKDSNRKFVMKYTPHSIWTDIPNVAEWHFVQATVSTWSELHWDGNKISTFDRWHFQINFLE